MAILIALTIGIVTPTTTTEIIRSSYAQSTGDFPQALTVLLIVALQPQMEITSSNLWSVYLEDASEEDISGALEGSGGSTPTEQEIRDCFAPLYNTGGASGTTTTGRSGSTDDGGSTGDSDETEQSSEDQDEDSGSDNETSE